MNKDPGTEIRAKKVAIYVRVSTEDQLEGYGAEAQKESILNLIKAKGNLPEPLVFAGEEHFYFDQGISGTVPLDERPAFSRLKEAVVLSSEHSRPFDIVAVYRIDRFARKLKVLLNVISLFEENEIEFLSVTENIDTSTPFGKAILSIIGVIAELELETIKARTRSGREQAIKAGTHVGNAATFGFMKTPDKKLSVFEEEAKYVQLIFDQYVNQKKSVGEIAKYLKEHKVLSPGASAIHHNKRSGRIQKQNSSFHWTNKAVQRILSEEKYTGKYYYNRYKNGSLLPKDQWELSPFRLPIIIDQLTFTKAQDLKENSKHTRTNPGRRPNPYLLSGLLRCNACSELRKDGKRQHWTGVSKKIKKGTTYTYYYVCGRKNSRKYEKRCTVLPLPAKAIETFITNYCLELLNSPVSVIKHQKKLRSEKVSKKHLQTQIQNINELLEGIPKIKKRLLEEHRHGYLSIEQLNKEMEEINFSQKRYIDELIELEKQFSLNVISDNYQKILKLFSNSYKEVLSNIKKQPKEVYKVLHMLIDEIVIYSRPVNDSDVIAGRKSKNQLIPERLHIKLKLPQDILTEIAKTKNPVIKTTSLGRDGVSGSRFDVNDGGC